ncbi:cobalamin biosynthesis protein [Acetobacter suratthaniensis]|uniref:Cobalamin biosynthesis protein n=1 Tax=Acetobacter suratthaniensis TaxID=1502841 RepID=A0ABS3LLX3_9PROT|nr:cobalamin biosynthesis protein [Acetobacter suratthaniensis]MBO1328365.1 cobalamin biosynthesis protein [Acetobacter suratthaniensis]MCX2566488.1 cobalamin biosynthesis protein [Acetobacter suratthaniensis]
MRVVGFGLRPHAPREALEQVMRGVLDQARSHNAQHSLPDAVATLARRVQNPALLALARDHGLPVMGVDENRLAGVVTPTGSPRIQALFGTGSVAEATALLAAGHGAQIIVARIVSTDGTASAAWAETEGLMGA